ncbi:MAG TPA: sulfatase-like hydrolase/transferase, partial [Adhaeribacter sp.]|nr:sulfatase-like hydrolase/transferase [Adhaeribacter sp.]
IHESIGYTDHALRRFFETASKQPWYRNTLFIITADHTQESADPDYQNELGRFRVPLLLFHPAKKLPAPQPGRITQHADLAATITDYLNLKTSKLLPFGRSVLDTTQAGRAVFQSDEHYLLLHQDIVTRLNYQDEAQFFSYQPQAPAPLQNPQPAKQEKYRQELKAMLQFNQNGLIENELFFWLKR